MARPWVRLVLVLAGLSALAAAGTFLWSSESRTRAADTSLRLATESGRRALADASDLRAAQQAYVAAGQGEDFWFARVSTLSTDLDDVLSILKRQLASAEALADADAAAAALQDFQQVDKRAREFTRARQITQASDVIFGDGFELTQKLTASVTQAVSAEAVARDAAAAQLRQRQAIVLGSGAGVAALALLFLIPGGAPRTEEPAVVLAKPAVAVSKRTLDDLHDSGVVARPAPRATVAERPNVDVAAMASLCADLARVADTRAVPELLGRAAALLDASGIVLWIADPDGRELSPILVHGYPPQMASRLGTIPRDAANLTASAYRTALMQIVKADAVSNGAIAAPLVGPGGCLGVMALEMKNGGEQRESLLAAATILASQLSTLVGPPSARARSEAAG